MSNDNQPLTKEQVYDVLQMAQSMYGVGSMYGIQGAYTPELSNQVLLNLNNNALTPTYKRILEALANYKERQHETQAFSEFMEKFDMIYARAVEYYSNLLAFDLRYSCINASENDYVDGTVEKAKSYVNKFLNSFNYKSEFQKITREVLRHETCYVWFRSDLTTGDKNPKFAIQLLPQDRCKLTRYWENGLLFDFDMTYFLMPGVDINGYDPVFKKYFNEVFISDTFKNYIPSNQFSKTGNFAYWIQTTPPDGAWVFKRDMSNFVEVPFLAPFLKNVIRNDEIRKLQYDKDFQSAYAILAGEMRMFDNAKSGTQKDQFSVDPGTLGKLLSLVKSGLNNNIKLAAMPVEKLSWLQYKDDNPDMVDTYYKNSVAPAASASRLIYSTDKMSNMEIENALMSDYQVVAKLYLQFNMFLNYYVNRYLATKRIKLRFDFRFEGSIFPFERKNRQDQIMALADKGITLNPSAFASAYGYTPMEFENMLNESYYSDRWNKLVHLISIHTIGQNKGGRPMIDNGDLTPSGEANRNS